MADFWIKPMMAVNRAVYRLSGGRLGSRMAGRDVLLLETRGRKTGKEYLTPINYYQDGNGYVVVASNWGKPSHPNWYYNLKHQSAAAIHLRGKRIPVSARDASGEEYERLWRLVTQRNHFYAEYQKQTDRQIPLVILTPQS